MKLNPFLQFVLGLLTFCVVVGLFLAIGLYIDRAEKSVAIPEVSISHLHTGGLHYVIVSVAGTGVAVLNYSGDSLMMADNGLSVSYGGALPWFAKDTLVTTHRKKQPIDTTVAAKLKDTLAFPRRKAVDQKYVVSSH